MPATPIRILSWNVNGVRAVHKKGFLEWLLKEKPDLMCLQETKAMQTQLAPELVSPPGYTSYWNSAERPGYSGVATYSKIEPLSVKKGLGVAAFDGEGRVLQTEFKDFTLFNIYFPNGKMNAERLRFKMDFYDAALKLFIKLRKAGKKIVVCGDVNTAHKEIDLARPKENRKVSGFLPEECAWMDRWVAAGFIDTFRVFHKEPDQYTWWDMLTRARDRNVGWRIDYFFISEELRPNLTQAFIMPEVMGSDHCPVGISLKF